MTAPVTSRVGFWWALRSGWRGFVPAVIGHAVLQGVLVLGDPVPAVSWPFALRAVTSVLAIVVLVWLVVCWASTAVDGGSRSGWSLARHRTSLLVWAAALGLVAVAAALVNVLLAPVTLVLAAFVLPQVAAGARNPAAAALESVRAAPLHTVGAVLTLAVLVVLGAVAALLLGFFVTGVLAAVVTWLWFGASIVVVACAFATLPRAR